MLNKVCLRISNEKEEGYLLSINNDQVNLTQVKYIAKRFNNQKEVDKIKSTLLKIDSSYKTEVEFIDSLDFK